MSGSCCWTAIRRQRRVVDATGLTGDWEFDLSFAPPQLGLTLQPARRPMRVIVVDEVERTVPD